MKLKIMICPIPIVDSKIQQILQKKINDCFYMLKNSKKLLDIAKNGVELAIEQDEQIAEEWIKQEIKNLDVEN